MKQVIRVALSITTEKSVYDINDAILESIDGSQITLHSKKPIRIKENSFKSATICVTYGNQSNVIFFVDKLIPQIDSHRISFYAPKENEANLERFGLGVLKTPCVGYEKLRSMTKAKNTKKVVVA